MIGDVTPWHPMAGGAAVTPFSLAKALATAGHRVDYVALAPQNLQREVEWGEITYIASTNRYITPFLQYLKTRRRLSDYDVAHGHGIEGLGFAIHRRVLGDIRFVNGLYAGTVNRFPWNIRSPFDAYCYFSCKWADMVITASGDTKGRICDAYDIAASRIRVMYAGVDESFFASGTPQKPSDRFSLLFCGYLGGPRQVKGLDVLLEAMPTILATHDVSLQIIGTGERAEQYKAMCRELAIEERVSFLGFIEHSRLPPHFSSADLFVLPSRSESFGLVLAEAMASGLPVVSTRVGGIPEVVEEGATGLLVPPNDPPALAEAIIELLDDPERMRAMGVRGRERVRQHFTWDKVAERVVGFYQEIL
jgi:glycosyltransferase involved in cell wall biosynthesis